MAETDEEVICGWMEPRPELPDYYQAGLWSRKLWWRLAATFGGGMEWFPRELTLDRLWEVEERLTDEQWCSYLQWLSPSMDAKELAHADAPARIKALGAVIRGGK